MHTAITSDDRLINPLARRFGPGFRSLLAALPLLFLALLGNATYAAGIEITAARIWPANEYTRLTLETRTPVEYKLFTLDNPHRLVLDLENVDTNAVLNGLGEKVGASDPYIGAIRVGRFKPGVIRVVLDLKKPVAPQAFNLKPVGDYGHRLVLDVYPLEPIDPLMALLQKPGATPGAAAAAAGEQASADTPAATAPPTAAPPRVAEATRPQPKMALPRQRGAAPPKKAGEEAQRLVIVAIDPGHGGEDPGARGRRGTHEKNVTLSIAQRLKNMVDKEENMRAVLTRDGDYFVPLNMRVAKARKVNADLFVSIHADAFIKPRARGSSVFALSERGATSAAANWLAKRENEADLIGGVNLDVSDPYLKQTLLDLSQTATINDSLKLGRAVLSELGNINTLHKDDVEQAGFAVLKAPDIPSILVETAFISNPEEELRLRDEAYQDKMARAILAGIKQYFAQNPPLARSKLAQTEPDTVAR